MAKKKELDYEKKVCGINEGSSWALFRSLGWDQFPQEFLEKLKGKLLDVGCGAGYFTNQIKRSRPKVEIYGVDFSKKAIEIAKKDFPGIKFLTANVYKLPFPNNSFDAAIMRQTLEHLENPDKALAELRRILKPGGIFYSATPLEGSRFVLSPSRELSVKYQGHVQRFSKDSLISLLEKNGFKMESFYFSGYLFTQVMNYLCLNLYQLLDMPREFSVQGHIAGGNFKKGKQWLSGFRKMVFAIANIESKIIPKKIIGRSMHIIVHKTTK